MESADESPRAEPTTPAPSPTMLDAKPAPIPTGVAGGWACDAFTGTCSDSVAPPPSVEGHFDFSLNLPQN